MKRKKFSGKKISKKIFSLNKIFKRRGLFLSKANVRSLGLRLLPVLIILALIFGLAKAAIYYMENSPYFTLAPVELIGPHFPESAKAFEFYGLAAGTNIFDVDIEAISQKVTQQHPEFEEISISRVLPNKLRVKLAYRRAVAKIKAQKKDEFGSWGSRLGKDIVIDENGIVLPSDEDIIPEGLPEIIGADLEIPFPKVGRVYKSRNLQAALSFLKSAHSFGPLNGHKIVVVDAANYRNISFFLENEVEVKVGGGGFQEKLGRLSRIFQEPSIDLEYVKYIDLRFADVVIGPK